MPLLYFGLLLYSIYEINQYTVDCDYNYDGIIEKSFFIGGKMAASMLPAKWEKESHFL